MVSHNHNSSGFGGLLGRFGRTALRGINMRVQLMGVEWQEERLRLRDMLLWSVALMFLGLMGALLITAAIIFLFPQDLRVYITAAFGLLFEGNESKSLLIWLPLQRFGYRQLMYYVVVRSIFTALGGAVVGWGKVERTGADAGAEVTVTHGGAPAALRAWRR